MKIDVTQQITDYTGKPLEEEDIKNLRDIIVRALNTQAMDETKQPEVMTAEDKAKVFQLSMKLYSDKEVDLTLDDRSFIKDRVGKVFGALVYGRVCEILEEKTQSSAKDK